MTRIALLAATILTAHALGSSGARAQPVTGLYVGAGGGVNFLESIRTESVSVQGGKPFATPGKDFSKTGYVALASVGYGFGNGLRVELEGNYRQNDRERNSLFFPGGRERKYGGMGNVLFDLDIGSSYIYPYIGAGAGYQRVELESRLFTLGSPTLNFTTNDSNGRFAYQAIAGFSFPIPPVVGLSLTAEYRYFALTGKGDYNQVVTGVTPTANIRYKDEGDANHSLLVGLRYAFNVAPPAVAAAPAAPLSPPQSRTYLVFFDWDRADLTARARQIINEAAQATTRVAVTRIEVAGHADASGTAAYNAGLSQRRANAVAAELVRLGVPRAAIGVTAFGDTRLLVPTAAGVREPQNRRVEIVLR